MKEKMSALKLKADIEKDDEKLAAAKQLPSLFCGSSDREVVYTRRTNRFTDRREATL